MSNTQNLEHEKGVWNCLTQLVETWAPVTEGTVKKNLMNQAETRDLRGQLRHHLEAGANANALNVLGQTPLGYLAEHYYFLRDLAHTIMFDLLVQGANPLQHDRAIEAFLTSKITDTRDVGGDELVKTLFMNEVLEQKLVRDALGGNAFHALAQFDSRHLSLQLRNHGAVEENNVMERWVFDIDTLGRTPAHLLFSEEGHMVRQWKKSGDAEDGSTEENDLALAWVRASQASWSALEKMKALGFDLNTADQAGVSVMDLICQRIDAEQVILMKDKPVCALVDAEYQRRKIDDKTPNIVAGRAGKGVRL